MALGIKRWNLKLSWLQISPFSKDIFWTQINKIILPTTIPPPTAFFSSLEFFLKQTQFFLEKLIFIFKS
jgi:hypothetical protein